MKIAIINPGGLDNFGERAILVGTIYDMKEKHPGAQISVLGYRNIGEYDRPLAKLFDKLNIELDMDLIGGQSRVAKVSEAIKLILFPKFLLKRSVGRLIEADLVVAKGQESLTSSYGPIHFIDSVLEPIIARRFNPHVVLLGHSFGPINSGWQTLFAKKFLSKMEHLYPRDTTSKALLLELDVDEKKITQVKDLAFTAMRKLELPAAVSRDHCLIIPNAAIAADRESQYLDNLYRIVGLLLQQKIKVVVASSVTAGGWNDDYRLCRKIVKKYQEVELRKYKSLIDLLLDIKSSQRVISSRLHPLIMAIGLGTRVLAVSDATKVKGLLSDFNQSKNRINPYKKVDDSLWALKQ